jgi:hypothetical protein
MHRQPASKGSGTNSPRDVEGGIDLDLRPLQGVDEVAYLLGVPRATLYRWQSLIPRGSAGTDGPPGGAVSPLHTGRRPELHRTAAAQRIVTSRCCPAATNPTAPCPAEVRLWYRVAPEAAGPGLVPGMCASPAHDRENLGLGGRRVPVSRRWSGKTLTPPTGARSSLRCSPPTASKPQTRTGSPLTAPSPTGTPRYMWADSDPDDTTYVVVIAASLRQAQTCRSQYEHARTLAAHRGSPPVDESWARGSGPARR